MTQPRFQLPLPSRSTPPRALASILAWQLLLVLVAFPAAAHGQSVPGQPQLKPVEPGRTDTGPLAASNRVLPADLRMPLGFDRVYRFQARAGGRSPVEMFARRSGGVTAVFPRSQYTESPEGPIPSVPPGTTFYLGSLPDSVTGGDGAGSRNSPPRQAPANFVDRSAREPRADNSITTGVRQLDPRVIARSAATGTPQPGGPTGPDDRPVEALLTSGPRVAPPRPSVFGDETYRQKTVQKLLDQTMSPPSKGNPRIPTPDQRPSSTGEQPAKSSPDGSQPPR